MRILGFEYKDETKLRHTGIVCLSPVEYYQYMTTGIYPLIIPKAKGENNQSEASC